MVRIISNFLIIVSIFTVFACSEDIISTSDFEPLKANIRMEVQILDSTYQQYSRPFTQIYFTTYKISKDGSFEDYSQSDTTSCPNGWGVKELEFIFYSKNEIVLLGAACEGYDGANFRQIEITYDEAELRIDSTGNAGIIKTFAIYYK